MSGFLEIEGLAKAYGATQALGGVSFGVERGEVRALLGENGAGKSTCVKILNGLTDPDAGSIRFEDAAYAPRALTEARRAGVSTAFQELSLMPELSVGVNLCLPELPHTRLGTVSFKAVMESSRSILDAYGASDIDPTASVSTLSLADKQRVEIIRAFSREPRLLILDEPTAALTEVSWLFDQIAAMTARGGAVLFITHRLREVRDLCQQATVLRNGVVAGTVQLEDTTDADLFRLMIGRAEHGTERRTRSSQSNGAKLNSEQRPALRVKALMSGAFGPADLTVKQGEIVGVAGLEGQGQHTLFSALAGTAPNRADVVEVDGRPAHVGSPIASRRSGIMFVPEERKEQGLFPGMTTRANISISDVSSIVNWGVLSGAKEARATRTPSEAVGLDGRYCTMAIDQLSGGNQQKALIARALFKQAKCLLLFDPTRGVDVGTKESIYLSMRTYAGQGVGILFYSTELPELTALCDRCLVVYGNEIVGEVEGAELTEERLIELMHGPESAHVRRNVV